MTDNPYVAPAARVADQVLVPEQEPAFFPVSLRKLVLMSLATLGIYQVYWFYKNWKCVQRLFDDKLNAPIRAFFYGLTAYWLFRRVREHARTVDGKASLAAGALAIAVFVMAMAWRLPDPYWLVAYLSFLPLLPVQSLVNSINQKIAPEADTNSSFSGWNIAGLVVGALLLLLAIIGTFMGE